MSAHRLPCCDASNLADRHETFGTIRSVERNGKTIMTFGQGRFETTADRDGHLGGWSGSFDRVADDLARA